MLVDWGSWDQDFNTMTKDICTDLLAMINDRAQDFVCVPMQGSGTFSVEAALGSLLPRSGGKTLVLSNGAYGQRIAKIISYLGRPLRVLDKGDYLPPLPDDVDQLLSEDSSITDVVVVHCETSSGILNPIADLARVVKQHGKRFFIDAMSSFGALSLDVQEIPFDVCISSANKCIEGVPGFGFVLVRRDLITQRKGVAHSLSLDLYDQWQGFEQTGKWRFTPPTHVVAAFSSALAQHRSEGGAPGRLERYISNQRALVKGMRALGFKTLLADEWLSPIITTFISPSEPQFSFPRFYELMKERHFIIYPGKLTEVESFRLGNIGQIDGAVIAQLLVAVESSLTTMGIFTKSHEDTQE
jgi:2-aminoethylphosphonate-pyruvate transaminase